MPGSRGGRPPDASRDVAIREAALDLLIDVGYDGLTMDAVAARAGAGKNTVYRRWPGKAELVMDVIDQVKGPAAFADHGSLRADLHAVTRSTATADDEIDARLIVGLAAALSRHAELRTAFQSRFVAPRIAGLREVFERAVARGEIAADRDLDLLAELFPALVLQRLLVTGAAPGADFMSRVMDEAVIPLAMAT